ncbi:MAG: D-alanyl-D-alanine carboxypeptidase, partial [Propionibacteriales bacterium]|nr:D-alanyl-D-alanine carboxypeptidase [Propionibacteriales bacterium]
MHRVRLLATMALVAPTVVATIGVAAQPSSPTTVLTPASSAAPSSPVIVNGTRYRPTRRVPPPPLVHGRAWAIADLRTGVMLGVHRPRVGLAPGSTIKLLTALTAVRRVARLPRHRATQRESSMICSCAGIIAARRYPRADLLAGTLVPSGNDAAETLAGSDPVGRRAFINAMNRRTDALGLFGTHAGNPSGLDHPVGYSTARDLVVLLRAAYRHDLVRPYLDLRRTRIGPLGGPTHVVVHRTPYVHTYADSVAAKSGTTRRAGKVLVAITRYAGRLISVALMGSPDDGVTGDVRALTVWAARH